MASLGCKRPERLMHAPVYNTECADSPDADDNRVEVIEDRRLRDGISESTRLFGAMRRSRQWEEAAKTDIPVSLGTRVSGLFVDPPK
jgi:hypothetical protein